MTGLVFDIGGTYLRAALYRNGMISGSFLKRATPTRALSPSDTAQELQEKLQQVLGEIHRTLLPLAKPDWFAAAVAGPVSPEGVVHRAPSLWGSHDRALPLRSALTRKFGIPGLVVNDVTAAAAHFSAEKRFARYPRLGILTVSTGIGLKIWDRKRNECLLGPTGFGGEIGHWPWPGAVEVCSCGQLDHLNGSASGRSVEAVARRLARTRKDTFRRSVIYSLVRGRAADINTYHLAVLAQQAQDPFLAELMGALATPIAHALCALTLALGLEKFIVMGGVASAYSNHYRRALVAEIHHRGIYGRTRQELEALVDLADPAIEPGLTGAARLGRQAFSRG